MYSGAELRAFLKVRRAASKAEEFGDRKTISVITYNSHIYIIQPIKMFELSKATDRNHLYIFVCGPASSLKKLSRTTNDKRRFET